MRGTGDSVSDLLLPVPSALAAMTAQMFDQRQKALGEAPAPPGCCPARACVLLATPPLLRLQASPPRTSSRSRRCSRAS